MRTTLNLSDKIVEETQALYDTQNRSNAVEQALKDAIRYKKLQKIMSLKGKVEIDDAFLKEQRRAEINETESNG